jgi:hypothetical protein
MMDDIAEQQDVAREISEAISNPVAFGHDFDEVSILFTLNFCTIFLRQSCVLELQTKFHPKSTKSTGFNGTKNIYEEAKYG